MTLGPLIMFDYVTVSCAGSSPMSLPGWHVFGYHRADGSVVHFRCDYPGVGAPERVTLLRRDGTEVALREWTRQDRTPTPSEPMPGTVTYREELVS